MRIDTFKIEEWMNKYCSTAKYDLTTTCIEPLSLRELLNICNIDNASDIIDTPLNYGEIFGSKRLKTAIKNLYNVIRLKNITITHGAIGANDLVYRSLIEKDDDIIVIIPSYQQHYSIPKSLGANVNFIYLKEESNWNINLRELENKITKRTKLISLTNPNNPTGGVLSNDMISRLIEIARANNVWILADEAYRGLNLSENPYSISFADNYEKGISIGSMSKTYSLPGLRLGWICAREDLIAEVNKHREYNTISISALDEYFSALALENKDKIIYRNSQIMKQGLETLTNWLNNEIYIKANLPQGGTTILARYKKDLPSKTLCKNLHSKYGVALLPGSTMEMEGYVRIGYCINSETLKTGLELFSKYLRSIN